MDFIKDLLSAVAHTAVVIVIALFAAAIVMGLYERAAHYWGVLFG